MKYAIWKRFSPEARRAAASAPYSSAIDEMLLRRTPEGCCPLGVALNADRVRHSNGVLYVWSSPPSFSVAGALGLKSGTNLGIARFMRAWDRGRISPTDLPSLLEVA